MPAQAWTWRVKIHASTSQKSKGMRKRGPGGWRFMQAWTRRGKARASADLEAKGFPKCGPGGSRSGQGRIQVQRKCIGLHGRATGADGQKVGVHQRRTRESRSKEWWASNPTRRRWQSVSSYWWSDLQYNLLLLYCNYFLVSNTWLCLVWIPEANWRRNILIKYIENSVSWSVLSLSLENRRSSNTLIRLFRILTTKNKAVELIALKHYIKYLKYQTIIWY